VRALLVARKQLQHKLTDIEFSIRGILRGFGLKVGKVAKTAFEKRIRELVNGHAMLEQIAEAMLSARITLLIQFNKLHKAVLRIVRQDEVCRRFMTTPSVGDRGNHLQVGPRRPHSDQEVQERRTALRTDAREVPIGRDGHHRGDHADW
jgi:transposase